jgi:hypothetical protein
MTIEQLRNSGTIIFEGIVGSQAYGIATPTSDIDKKGVFIQDEDSILGFGYIDQVNDSKNDQTFYEIRRFLELLASNNPNILELLNLPDDCVIHKDPIFDLILEHRNKFITKMCRNSFGGYAVEQIRKARGLNKKISNPMDPQRKGVLDFCYVVDSGKSVRVDEYMEEYRIKPEYCGLVSLDHMKYMYSVYYDRVAELNDKGIKMGVCSSLGFKGIVSSEENANDVCTSSVPKGMMPDFVLYFNKEGYSSYCKDYKEYFEWVEKRNEARYNDNVQHGKGYDSKNLCHCFRLLEMAREIGRGEGIIIRRPNREYLLKIRRGEMDYDYLISKAEDMIEGLNEIYEKSNLPNSIDKKFMDRLLISIRKEFYNRI